MFFVRRDATSRRDFGGWTLIELVIVMTVLSILTLGVIPLVKTAVKRQREQQLRESLREMREAIKEFHRDTIGIQCGGIAGLQSALGPQTGAPPATPTPQTAGVGTAPPIANAQTVSGIDPRSKVIISDCTIFGVDNPDHYPPDLDALVKGVNVVPRGVQAIGGSGLNPGEAQATDNKLVSLKKKVYLRKIPVDPITGKDEWDLRSDYDAPDASSWGGENVFDVHSKSNDTALNGKDKYSDW